MGIELLACTIRIYHRLCYWVSISKLSVFTLNPAFHGINLCHRKNFEKIIRKRLDLKINSLL